MRIRTILRGTIIGTTYASIAGCVAGSLVDSRGDGPISDTAEAVTASDYAHGPFQNTSTMFNNGPDWDVCHGKVTCAQGATISGMSELPGGFGHKALCKSVGSTVFSGTVADDNASAPTLVNDGASHRRAQRSVNGSTDWADGHIMLECGMGEYVSAVSENATACGAPDSSFHGVQCSKGKWLAGTCSTRVFKPGNDEGTTLLGDWDYGYYKASCRDNEFVAGVSIVSPSSTDPSRAKGAPYSILCCESTIPSHAFLFDEGTLGDALGGPAAACASTDSTTPSCPTDVSREDTFDNNSLRLQNHNVVRVSYTPASNSQSLHVALRLDSKAINHELSLLEWGPVSVRFNSQGSNGYKESCTRFKVNGPDVYICDPNKNIRIEEWFDITIVADGVNATIYIDGVQRGSLPLTGFPTGAQTLSLGAYNAQNESFSGLLDDVELYDRALSTADVSRLAAATAQRNAFRRPAPSLTSQLSTGQQKFIGIGSVDTSAWVGGTLLDRGGTDAAKFSDYSTLGFTSQTSGAARSVMTSDLSQRYLFLLPYGVTYDTDVVSGTQDPSVQMHCGQPLPSDSQQTFNTILQNCRNDMDAFTAVPNVANRVHILSGGDELSGECYPQTPGSDCNQSPPSARNFFPAAARAQYFAKLSVAKQASFPNALLEYSEAGGDLLSDAFQVTSQERADFYRLTASTLSGVPFTCTCAILNDGLPPNLDCKERAQLSVDANANVDCISHHVLWETLNRMGYMRRIGLGGNGANPGDKPIPYGNTIQGLRQQKDGHTGPTDPWYEPSDAQIRLAYYLAWGYGAKWTAFFNYDASDVTNILFSGESPGAKYTLVQGLNQRAKQIGPALVRLLNTDMRLHFTDQNESSSQSPFRNLLPYLTSRWSPLAAPYMTNITVTNTGSANGGQPGGVLLSYFRPLSEELAGSYGPTGSLKPCMPDPYFMVTNALAYINSTDTSQNITIDLSFTGDYDSVQWVDPASGQVQDVPLVTAGGHKQLVLDGVAGHAVRLRGGEGQLFKLGKAGNFTCFNRLLGVIP